MCNECTCLIRIDGGISAIIDQFSTDPTTNHVKLGVWGSSLKVTWFTSLKKQGNYVVISVIHIQQDYVD